MSFVTPSLLVDATLVGDGPTVMMRSDRSRDEVVIQVAIVGGTASVEIYGKVTERLPWVLLTTITASGIYPIARVASLRATVASISGATVNSDVYMDS